MFVWNFFARIARLVLPPSLIVWLRGDFKSVSGRLYKGGWERIKLRSHLIRGGTYLDWYADRMDGFASNPNVDPAIKRSYHDSGIEDLQTVKKLGLKETDSLHEFGCGFLRSAYYFIDYLDDGKYSGNDTSGVRMRTGAEYIKKVYGYDIGIKHPLLIVNKDNTFNWLGRKADMIWCYAVFTHMPEIDIEDVIKNLPKALKRNAGFYFTYSEKKGLHAPVTRMGAGDWWHRPDFFEQIVERHRNLKIEHMTEFLHAQSFSQSVDRLSKITLVSGE